MQASIFHLNTLCSTIWILSCFWSTGCSAQNFIYDLAIHDVNIFNSRQKTVEEDKVILIHADSIAAIVDVNSVYQAKHIIDGRERLVTPGFIDTHTHLNLTYESEKNIWPDALDHDAVGHYRSILTDQYLKYGTTSIVDMGQSEDYMSTSLVWQQNPSPDYPNIYVAGGAMISDEERETYVNHVEIENPEAGREKVRSYKAQGVRHLKLYKRLRAPELKAVVEEAQNQNLVVFGHIDDHVVSIQQALDMGVIHFEHLLSLPASILVFKDHYDALTARYGVQGIGTLDEYAAAIMFFFEYIKDTPAFEEQLLLLFEQMADKNATLSTTIHVLGATAEKTSFFSSFEHFPERASPILPGYTDALKLRLAQAFDTMMFFLKTAHEKGVKIRIGTDCKNGGRALLSELILLYEAGFAMEDILQIATWNGYEAMGLLDNYGSIEKGKKADLILFDENPFENHTHVLSEKVIIKDGIVLEF